MQGDSETVADYVSCLEKAFHVAFGSDGLRWETKEAMFYGQLQKGLHLGIRSPSVSGALNYKGLCMAAKHEEQRQAEIRKCQEYGKSQSRCFVLWMLCLVTLMVNHLLWELDRMKYKCSSAKNVSLLGEESQNEPMSLELPTEQRKDPFLWALIDYLQNGELPRDTKQSQIIAAKASTYCIINYVLYFNNKKRRCRLIVVPRQLQKRMIEEYHGGPLGGHYSGNCLYNTLSNNWY